MTWREYHELTKHTSESLRRSRHFLDWANMPDPFRHYEGAPVLDLPADPAPPAIAALAVLQGLAGAAGARDGAEFLSQLLFYSAAVSASKRVPSTGKKYALRVNPSSGNLHPTEFHFATRGLRNWPDGTYHYRPSSHMAEQRAVGDPGAAAAGVSAPVVFALTSIAWREAWKYQNRAYRYCLHDVGHAWQALALAARALGCETFATGAFADDGVAHWGRFNQDEWPMLLIAIHGPALPLRKPDAGPALWSAGRANVLSDDVVDYPAIDAVHRATKLEHPIAPAHVEPAPASGRGIALPAPASSLRFFGEAARARRSALDFTGGANGMSLAQLSAILDAAVRRASADFTDAALIQLYAYVHRVEDLEPGVYRHWPRLEGALEFGALELVRRGDQRVAIAGMSLGQNLAGNACVAFSMIADLERAARIHGARGYRYAHFEAGASGQRMYLAAAALGLGATGIGAFFDDRVHEYLGLAPNQGQVVYHFAVGHPVPDARLEA